MAVISVGLLSGAVIVPFGQAGALSRPGGPAGTTRQVPPPRAIPLIKPAMAISGTTAVVIAQSPGSFSSQAYVFDEIGASWHREGALAGLGATSPVSVALADNTLVIGSPYVATGGLAFVYTKSGLTFRRVAVLQGGPHSSGSFGVSVATNGTDVLVGNPDGTRTGAAYAYRETGSTWRFSQRLVDPVPLTGGHFGSAVAVSGTTAVVGAAYATGHAFAYTKVGPNWQLSGPLSPTDLPPGAELGESAAVAGTDVVVGSAAGAYAFQRIPQGWAQLPFPLQDGRAQANRPGSFDGFGASVGVEAAVNGDLAFAVGAPGVPIGTPPPGQVQVFGWSHVASVSRSFTLHLATLSAPTSMPGDGFGVNVAVSGDTLLVAAQPVLIAPEGDGPGISAEHVYVYRNTAAGWRPAGELSL